MTDQNAIINYLRTLIHNHTGLTLETLTNTDLTVSLTEISAAHELSNLHRLSVALADSPLTAPLWHDVIEAITIGETYFFRNAFQFQALTKQVLPEIIARKRKSGIHHLRLWSAGCASGEEPYSLAMLLHELIPDLADWHIHILGTDINASSLKAARRGIYRKRSFRTETRDDVQEKWFEKQGDEWILNPSIRAMVMFTPLNLITDHYPAYDTFTVNMDLIVCRNVTIYFDDVTTRRVVERFHQSLNPEGWLVVGHAEPLVSTYKAFTAHNFANTVMYQKAAHTLLPELITPAPPVIKAVPAAPRPESQALMMWERAKQAADRGDVEATNALLDKAERETPLMPQVHYLRGLLAIQQQQRGDAFHALRRALYCDPGFVLAHYSLGELYYQRQAYREAARHWQQANALLAECNDDDYLPFGEEITAEHLKALIDNRWQQLPKESRKHD